MRIATRRVPYICARCLPARGPPLTPPNAPIARLFSRSPPTLEKTNSGSGGENDSASKDDNGEGHSSREEKEKGALSQRLEQMTEEALETGGRSARKAVEEAGFDENLRKELEERILNANFRNQYAGAISQANLPDSAGRGTRDIAGARPWTGTEAPEDTALRMLHDAYKPLRGTTPKPGSVRTPTKVDTGRPRKGKAQGQRLVNARDKSSHYSFMKDGSVSEKEREQMRKEMKARFDPGARSLPVTLQGLASLANERIEDAIARGQFKNLPRGMKIERDYNASSPFIDTTEYLLNKIIQKQDIVPPWIEKQQELISTATKFRARLRNDWKRHAARSIASRGGSLDTQIRKAQEYAAAEMIVNPPTKKEETINVVDPEGHVSQISLAGELKATPVPSGTVPEAREEDITVTEKVLEGSEDASSTNSPPKPEIQMSVTQPPPPPPVPEETIQPPSHPFRDPQWLSAEQSYLEHTINHLNALTRSYNLMAPDLAKKPYYSLDRELAALYRDVAPQVANEIRERALAPKAKVEWSVGQSRNGVLLDLGAGQKARVWDENPTKQYGLKEFWRDLFARS
ncbi:hypothetical protein NA57DRAFT_69889 [Rhizodiscina lignyota]|uniref:DnaJ homologue subfamily C member 28 conserved domain-containing protein n=1 Tax=Rhizodiscina lignyota TaxID=1504668 RepID=A0A9P4MAH1_9PEZI|nr:hypothetical protein NA57DRAFT_69889 [Rhizodiscina lignyota]